MMLCMPYEWKNTDLHLPANPAGLGVGSPTGGCLMIARQSKNLLGHTELVRVPSKGLHGAARRKQVRKMCAHGLGSRTLKQRRLGHACHSAQTHTVSQPRDAVG